MMNKKLDYERLKHILNAAVVRGCRKFLGRDITPAMLEEMTTNVQLTVELSLKAKGYWNPHVDSEGFRCLDDVRFKLGSPNEFAQFRIEVQPRYQTRFAFDIAKTVGVNAGYTIMVLRALVPISDIALLANTRVFLKGIEYSVKQSFRAVDRSMTGELLPGDLLDVILSKPELTAQ